MHTLITVDEFNRHPLIRIQNNLAEEVPLIETKPGIYFLLRNKEIVYVGSSVTPAYRVYSHRFYGDRTKKFDQAFYIPIKELVYLQSVEKVFIQKLQPIENKMHK